VLARGIKNIQGLCRGPYVLEAERERRDPVLMLSLRNLLSLSGLWQGFMVCGFHTVEYAGFAGSNLERYVTKFAPRKALNLIA